MPFQNFIIVRSPPCRSPLWGLILCLTTIASSASLPTIAPLGSPPLPFLFLVGLIIAVRAWGGRGERVGSKWGVPFFSRSGARFLLLDRRGDSRRRRGEWRSSEEEGRGNQGNHPAIMDVPRGLPHGTWNNQCSSNFDFYPSSTLDNRRITE